MGHGNTERFLLLVKVFVLYHSYGKTGWSTVCANGRQNLQTGNLYTVPFEIGEYFLCRSL